jgi:iron-sulfur cluster repair protein YtfE (RIC family)
METGYAGWLVAIVTLLIFLYTVRTRGQDMSDKKLSEVLKPINETQERFQRYHGTHFDAISGLTSKFTALDQKLTEHEKRDDERFGRIEEMHREIRDDIKTLLGRPAK